MQAPPAHSAAGSHVAVLIDPENYQDSEQRFLASLEMPAAPQQVVPQPPAEFYRPDVWREEVASRVDAYRAKRGRRRPDPSSLLSFDFDPPQTSEREMPIAVNADSTWEPPAPVISMPPPAFPDSNVIEFPRQAVAEPEPEIEFLVDELAEPIIETPRILEAPPEDMAPPEFGGVSLAPITLEEHPIEGDTEAKHMRVAARGLRIFSGLVDACLVGLASALFAMIFVQMNDAIPHTRFALAMAVAIPGLFWAAYQYVFLVYSAATPGMQLANLKLSTFDGGWVHAGQRRWRTLAMLLSFISVGFGFAWAFLDPEGLSWHDKITRTYLTQRSY